VGVPAVDNEPRTLEPTKEKGDGLGSAYEIRSVKADERSR
jgi:hypothetical protein